MTEKRDQERFSLIYKRLLGIGKKRCNNPVEKWLKCIFFLFPPIRLASETHKQLFHMHNENISSSCKLFWVVTLRSYLRLCVLGI